MLLRVVDDGCVHCRSTVEPRTPQVKSLTPCRPVLVEVLRLGACGSIGQRPAADWIIRDT
jgi:hypothetical protein